MSMSELADADADTVVESGCPLRTHGSGFIGGLEIKCDGTIAGQIWGAGAALAQKLLQDGLPDRPDVVEVGAGTGVAGLAAAVAGCVHSLFWFVFGMVISSFR